MKLKLGNVSKCKLDDAATLKHLVAVIAIDPSLSKKQLSRFTGVGQYRIARLLKPVAFWRSRKWVLKRRPVGENVLRNKVLAVTESLKTMKPLDAAIKNGVTMGTVLGIMRGQYKIFTAKDEKRRVRVGNMLKFYDEKGYEPSGKSIKGALEMSADCDQIKCHECGGWLDNLNVHIRCAHALKAADYKRKHGLKQGAALIGESTRLALIADSTRRLRSLAGIKKAQVVIAAMRANGFKSCHVAMSTERRNQHVNCGAQIAYDLRILVDRLKRVPTKKEVKAAGINYTILLEKYGTIEDAAKIVSDSSLEKKPATRWYSNDELIAMLNNFGTTHKRPPFRSDCRRGMLPSSGTFRNRFGSWNKALVAAGFKKHADGWTGYHTFKKAARSAQMQNGAPLSFAARA